MAWHCERWTFLQDPAEINVSRPIAFQTARRYIFSSHLTAAYPVNAISRIMMIIVGARSCPTYQRTDAAKIRPVISHGRQFLEYEFPRQRVSTSVSSGSSLSFPVKFSATVLGEFPVVARRMLVACSSSLSFRRIVANALRNHRNVLEFFSYSLSLVLVTGRCDNCTVLDQLHIVI